MKKEYDFSKGVRGKFYNENMTLILPVYLDSENMDFLEKLAREKKSDPISIVNKLVKESRKIANVLK